MYVVLLPSQPPEKRLLRRFPLMFRGLCWILSSQALKPFSSSCRRQFCYLVSLATGPSSEPDLSSRKRDSSAWGYETSDIPASSRSRFEAWHIERRSQTIIVILLPLKQEFALPMICLTRCTPLLHPPCQGELCVVRKSKAEEQLSNTPPAPKFDIKASEPGEVEG